MMNFDEFVNVLWKDFHHRMTNFLVHDKKELLTLSSSYTEFGKKISDISQVTPETFLVGDETRTGDAHGGSCWGGNLVSVPGEGDPTFDILSDILLHFDENVTLKQMRNVENSIADSLGTFSYTVSEYYGNYTDYAMKFITLNHLYEAMEKERII